MNVFTSIISLFLLTFSSFAQVSYDFSITLPPYASVISTVPKSFYGIYSSEFADIDYEFSDKGIFAISTIYNQISRETVRESSKYRVENGWLFGVQVDDSIPCILEGEYYVFGIKYREQIIGGTSNNKCTALSSTAYLVNFEDNGKYTPSLFEFKGKTLVVSHFTYDNNSKLFDGIATQTTVSTAQMNYVSLSPTLEEWNKISIQSILSAPILFTK